MVLYILRTIMTLVVVPHAIANFCHYPWAWRVVVFNVLAIANIPRAIYKRKPFYAFLSSCATIAGLIFLLGIAIYPNLVRTSMPDGTSLTISNAYSSPKTLRFKALIAAIGLPFVLAYTGAIYWTFRGKVRLGVHSY